MMHLFPTVLGALGLYEKSKKIDLTRASSPTNTPHNGASLDLSTIQKGLTQRAISQMSQGDKQGLSTTLQAIQKLNRLTQEI